MSHDNAVSTAKPALENPGRRGLLKMSLAAGTSAAIVSSNTIRAQGAGLTPPSPPTRPWMNMLPFPIAKRPVQILTPAPAGFPSVASGECGRDLHQHWGRFKPKYLYELRVKQAMHSFHPDLPSQPIWGYDGTCPGPMFHSRYGSPVMVRIHNDLPPDALGPGSPEISTHFHNAHVPSESDGFAGNFYSRTSFGPTIASAGAWQDYCYPMAYAGFEQYGGNGDPREGQGTLWYHDHRMDFTAPHGYRGLAGFHLLFDHIDSGNENDTNPQALRLPSGAYDFPLMLADKQFDATGKLFYDQFAGEGFVGDKVTVNGKIQPYCNVARRKYRFRLLNAGPARIYDLVLRHENRDQRLTFIASDGNLMPEPLELDHVEISPAERADIVIDFKRFPIGSELYLVNRFDQRDGRKPREGLLIPGMPIVKFVVTRDVASDPSRVPSRLRELPPIDLSEVVATRRFQFKRANGIWTVNDRIFDVNTPIAQVKKGTAEIWELDGSGGWWHPVHIHLEEGRILSRGGLPPPLHEQGRKDVYVLHDEETIRIFIRFRDFTGKYLMHCHNTVHEDHAMMLRYDIVP
jgi:FtsP/CotA-like multicopper oxidase with cupredoxin domain